jgi:hypothetical protein
VPAAAVIPAPVAYERPVKAEKLVVGSACGKYGSHSVSRVPVRNPHYNPPSQRWRAVLLTERRTPQASRL